MVPADSRRIPRVPRYSGYRYASSRFEYRTLTVFGLIFQTVLLTRCLAMSRSYNPPDAVFGLFPVRSPLLGESLLFSFPAGTKMFQFPALASQLDEMMCLQHIGLSHSEIRGSGVICTSPQLIAAYHVLHRLREPRHPPCALSYFPYHVHTPSSDGCGMIYTFSFRTKITFCLLHHVIDRFSNEQLIMND